MFQVLENDKPAINDSGWSVYEFEKWYDAVEYLRAYAGDWKCELPAHPKLNVEYKVASDTILKIVRIK